MARLAGAAALRTSWYFLSSGLPAPPERQMRARDWHVVRSFLSGARPDAHTPEDVTPYVEARSPR
jgi:hypothetical protein